ncbi:hypothetical protein HETIRDRAFT_166449 [Heterobasidion irregulare TC 32-1]|uniref:Uncharacterized protein n=1 Tax=Heterobasidion irregulare (strain TC 32-1) TaxID=747525 RepID=W4KPG2_HETIT|nr:uncharacterized protein HETIRDRAFT_166449 [Heterobasidion irregulare TC 32-1]ETW86931.1 hypothetical protein HETIRDRAFT_166449 [Heterobasidion irregulare TC 32-1]
MARSDALGRWLRDSSRSPALLARPGAAPPGAPGARRPVLSSVDRRALERELRWWRVRGALCIATLGAVLLSDLAGAFGHRPPSTFDAAIPYMPIYIFVSVLWTAWDPTWASLRQAQLQGRKVRVRGKLQYAVSARALLPLLRFFETDDAAGRSSRCRCLLGSLVCSRRASSPRHIVGRRGTSWTC